MFPNINNMKIYLVCGKTNLRKGIDGLAALVIEAFSLDACDNAIFLFCGTCSDRFKALYWDKTGFVLYYKRIESGHFQWPRNQSEVKKINAHQLRRLLSGFSVEEKKLLSNFNGYVQTDGYAGYNFLDRTRHLGCLAHVRRYFVDSLKNSSYKASKSFSGEIVKDIDEVFELERKLSAKFNDDERLNYRRKNFSL